MVEVTIKSTTLITTGLLQIRHTEQRVFLLYFPRRLLWYNDIIELRSKIYKHDYVWLITLFSFPSSQQSRICFAWLHFHPITITTLLTLYRGLNIYLTLSHLWPQPLNPTRILFRSQNRTDELNVIIDLIAWYVTSPIVEYRQLFSKKINQFMRQCDIIQSELPKAKSCVV